MKKRYTFFNRKRWQVPIRFIKPENWSLPALETRAGRHHSTILSGANASHYVFLLIHAARCKHHVALTSLILFPLSRSQTTTHIHGHALLGRGRNELMSMTQPWLITWIIKHGWYLETPYAALYTLSAAPPRTYKHIGPELDMNYNVSVHVCKRMQSATQLRRKSWALLEVLKAPQSEMNY